MSAPNGKGDPWGFAINALNSAGRSCAPLTWLFLAAILLPGLVNAQSEPAWVSPTALATADGSATLKWSVIGDDPVALFKVTEEHAGALQVSYTDQPELQVSRAEQGKYTFLVQACTRSADGYPQCGEASRPLILTVAGATGDTELMRFPGKTPLDTSLLGDGAPRGGDAAVASQVAESPVADVCAAAQYPHTLSPLPVA